MNAVEIEEAVSALSAKPFDSAEFPFQFVQAFGAKDITVKRLRKGDTNASDVPGGMLWRNYIHLAVAEPGEVGAALAALRASSRTAKHKAKFILATDGDTLEAEDLASGDPLACSYSALGEHFAAFLPLAGISTVKEIKNNPIDVKATGRLNRLYVELLKDNPDWATEARRHELNQFMARLIFCFFAEDTGIFEPGIFTATINRMSHAGHGSGEDRWGNTHEILQHLFLAMDTPVKHEGKFDDRHRRAAGIRPWADVFPYVNGGMFDGARKSPLFSRTARAYLLRAGELDWKEINPDIFGSMIQAVADDDERGELGMHYTSVPNILKVLNPLFLDDLREQLEAAGESRQKLRSLRKRLANIRVFDPACGSGNFLVIAYKEMRAIEAEIVQQLGGEANLKLEQRRSVIPLSNFYGIEIKGFAAEIARLALLIAEFQADCLYLSQREARAMVLPLHRTGQIHVGNALRLDWLEVCPPVAGAVAVENDLGGPTGRLALDADGLSEGAEIETYICGNPPYLGAKKKSPMQVEDMELAGLGDAKLLDYVAAFICKGLPQVKNGIAKMALVSTSSICQGEQVGLLWPRVLASSYICFAYTPFKWSNSAANNAGVYCTVIGLGSIKPAKPLLISDNSQKVCSSISPYLVEGEPVIVSARREPLSDQLSKMEMGSNPVDGKRLILEPEAYQQLIEGCPDAKKFLRRYGGTDELVSGLYRWCVWISDEEVDLAREIPSIANLVENCRIYRETAGRDARKAAKRPHAFCYSTYKARPAYHIGLTIGNAHAYVPIALITADVVSSHTAYTLYDPQGWELAVIASRLQRVWTEAVGGKLGNGTRYSNTLVYNTFPVPKLTEQNKADLTRRAENILLAREAYFPATIADLYDPETMPADLHRAHEENDEVLERIYIGRRFRNDTERLEKLFELYTKMTAEQPKAKKGSKAA
jgi:hypothetical protein